MNRSSASCFIELPRLPCRVSLDRGWAILTVFIAVGHNSAPAWPWRATTRGKDGSPVRSASRMIVVSLVVAGDRGSCRRVLDLTEPPRSTQHLRTRRDCRESARRPRVCDALPGCRRPDFAAGADLSRTGLSRLCDWRGRNARKPCCCSSWVNRSWRACSCWE